MVTENAKRAEDLGELVIGKNSQPVGAGYFKVWEHGEFVSANLGAFVKIYWFIVKFSGVVIRREVLDDVFGNFRSIGV